jgi:lactoylglutathione lyase
MGIIGSLRQVILYVEDMDEQLSFYRDKMGFEVKSSEDSDDSGGLFWVELETGDCTLALHAGGERRLGKDAPEIVFRVSSIQSAREELVQQGIPMGEIRSIAPGVWICHGNDPEGNRFSIEFAQ